MADYTKLTKSAQPNPSKEIPYKFDMLDGFAPTIWSLPATEDNKPFMNESLRRVAVRRARRTKVTNADTVKASRQEDKELLAAFCAKRWDMEIDGAKVEFSVAEVQAFFEALPDFVFDDYRSYITDITNWIEAKELGEH